MSTYYQIESGTAPWGDYGYTLWNGFTEKNQERGEPTIVVSRTGPFVLPIMVLFGPVLVTEDFRQRLLPENFSGLSFVPVGYRKVVRIPWDQCDANAREPAFYPDSGEPEDYLLEGAHDQELAEAMPRLWAWEVASTTGLQVQRSNTFRRDLHSGTDVAREYYIIWISERMKLWLAQNAGQWLSFVAVDPR